MILTPTYHVFRMYSEHQQNSLLDSHIAAGEAGILDNVESIIPDVIESASMNDAGDVIMTLCNLDLHESKEVEGIIQGHHWTSLSGEVIAGAMDDHNTFDTPEMVKVLPFEALEETETGFRAVLPPCSVVKIVAAI